MVSEEESLNEKLLSKHEESENESQSSRNKKTSASYKS